MLSLNVGVVFYYNYKITSELLDDFFGQIDNSSAIDYACLHLVAIINLVCRTDTIF